MDKTEFGKPDMKLVESEPPVFSQIVRDSGDGNYYEYRDGDNGEVTRTLKWCGESMEKSD